MRRHAAEALLLFVALQDPIELLLELVRASAQEQLLQLAQLPVVGSRYDGIVEDSNRHSECRDARIG